MGAGIIEVAIEFLHPLLFSGEVVVESLLLDDGEGELDLLVLFEALVEAVYFFAEVVKDFFERVVCVVA